MRLGIIGAGWVAMNAYIPAGAKVTHVLDIDPSRATELAARCGAVVVWDLDALVAQVDALIVCTPPHEHPDALLLAMRARKPALCEKPVIRAPAEAELDPRLVMGSATTRLRDDVQQLLRWVEEERLGGLRRVALRWIRGAGVPAPGSWRTDRACAPLGVLEDLGPHLLDVAQAIVPDDDPRVVESVLACRHGACPRSAAWFGGEGNSSYAVPDYCAARLATAPGVEVQIEVAWADAEPRDVAQIVIEGERGRAALDGLFGFSTERRVAEQTCRLASGGAVELLHLDPGPGAQQRAFSRSIQRFERFCLGLAPACADAHEIRRVARWMELIEEHHRLMREMPQ
ncbi:uncharacterized protein SOCEGT47_074580 [Sorangium cellulosum]|uniref:Uncharacterized protein n=1 Tax=Sorangium cellulosum TaxID=56 RepID=A0A4P2QC45_SORCE|nr:Gfo/Idh/MocA family oxidoreductase [Sorangium cellulosum]AUX26888.1 uncharacterized protein SOCEGT47_074580 [Sorangium cellulosum]